MAAMIVTVYDIAHPERLIVADLLPKEDATETTNLKKYRTDI